MGFYGYERRRRTDNVVDWSKVGQDIGDTIVQGAKDREAQRQELDESSRIAEKFVKDAPSGKSETLNTAVLDLSGQMSNRLLENKKMLKSGKITPTEYNRNIQTIRDEVELLYKGVNGWNDAYAKASERMQQGTSAGSEQFVMSQAEGYADFSNTKMVWGPNNEIIAVKVDSEGKPVDGSEIPVQTLFGRVGQTADKVDVEGQLDGAAKSIGEDIRGFANADKYGSISNIMGTKRYKEAEDTYINSLLVNDLQKGNILHDWVGMTKDGRDYEFTTDESEAKNDDSKILMVRDRNGNLVPELSNAQEQWLKDQLRKGLRSRLDYESDVNVRRTGNASGKLTAAERKNISRAESLYGLYSGDPNMIQAGANLLRGAKDKGGNKVVGVSRKGNLLSLTMEDSKGAKSIENLRIEGSPEEFVTALMNRFFGDASGIQYVDFGDSPPGQGDYAMDITKVESGSRDNEPDGDNYFESDAAVSLVAQEVLINKDGDHVIGTFTEDEDVNKIVKRLNTVIAKHIPKDAAEEMIVDRDPMNDDGIVILYKNNQFSIDLDDNQETVDNLTEILTTIRRMYYSGNPSSESTSTTPRASENGGTAR